MTPAPGRQQAFLRLEDDAPPSGTIQFYDGLFPFLKASDQPYSIVVNHDVAGETKPSYTTSQDFLVQGPQFVIDSSAVLSVYPPDGSTGRYGLELPFIILDDPSLPWERNIDPSSPTDDSTPWLAVLVFSSQEIRLDPKTQSPVATVSIGALLSPEGGVLKPAIPLASLGGQDTSRTCQSIRVKGAAFQAVVPDLDELPLLAHARAVNAPTEMNRLLASLLSSRLAAVTEPTRFYAHLVSLEGFKDYLGPTPATALPTAGSPPEPVDVQLVSLFGWSFTSDPSTGPSFEALIQGLVESQESTATLALPTGAVPGLGPSAKAMLDAGYVAAPFHTGDSENSLAWYRGPLTAQLAQPLPPVGEAAVPVVLAPSSDSLLIYRGGDGVFDVSYANAWQIGRAAALADPVFPEALRRFREAARTALGRASQRSVAAAGSAPAGLVGATFAHRHFRSQVGAGAAEGWMRAALTTPAAGAGPPPESWRLARQAAPHPAAMLERDDVVTAIAGAVDEALAPVAAWLAALRLLIPLPFEHLVPDPRMLPPESMRFFFVDPAWLDALQAGAMSLAVHGDADVRLQAALAETVAAAVAAAHRALLLRPSPALPAPLPAQPLALTGMLIRSALVSSWPTASITAGAATGPMSIARDSRLPGDIRLCLFEAVDPADPLPQSAAIAEPFVGIRFGIEDDGVAVRDVAGASPGTETGTMLPPQSPGPAPPAGASFIKAYCRTQESAVVKVAELARDVAKDQSGAAIGSGNLAIQLFQAPERQLFPTPAAVEGTGA